MANWCSNVVVFIGEQYEIGLLDALIGTMTAKEQKERKGQLPHFVTEDSGYLFDIHWEGEVLYFETKWVPNIAVITQIADQYNLGFIHNYVEPSMGIYGEATYENGTLTDVYLENEDLLSYDYDEQENCYRFENGIYHSEEEIHEILIERKRAIKLLLQ
ncbi:hypothetical protein J7E50_02905 [Pedobacter sp. ISL-68]|uniref:DUF1281 family ferredoxin-like fold protein n=1 Tax=unclassified Pedobacter TaxID=2628915 RepID=UPI001BE6A1DC|nr:MULTISPECIES: hypothetical protein [unclassified Pedobacter]MBT2560170.1 hypothetical protein [Pedobacter sp. ISL-64]MBT2589149.1 hypothetical protein [Pedobacter sp. ISL-68]